MHIQLNCDKRAIKGNIDFSIYRVCEAYWHNLVYNISNVFDVNIWK